MSGKVPSMEIEQSELFKFDYLFYIPPFIIELIK